MFFCCFFLFHMDEHKNMVKKTLVFLTMFLVMWLLRHLRHTAYPETSYQGDRNLRQKFTLICATIFQYSHPLHCRILTVKLVCSELPKWALLSALLLSHWCIAAKWHPRCRHRNPAYFASPQCSPLLQGRRLLQSEVTDRQLGIEKKKEKSSLMR